MAFIDSLQWAGAGGVPVRGDFAINTTRAAFLWHKRAGGFRCGSDWEGQRLGVNGSQGMAAPGERWGQDLRAAGEAQSLRIPDH